ncbi:MAG TPA: tripartite tricarboxylate transporter TctB family protein [Geminicoccaceae bacterium]
MVRADFITGLILAALGIGALLISLDMPRFEERNINPYTVPGLVPAALAAVIAALGAMLAARAARAGGWRLRGLEVRFLADDAARRVALTLLLTLGYAAGLVGRVPFWLATFVFAAGFVILFEWPKGVAGRLRRIALALLYAALLAAVVTYVFQEIFLVRLP